MQLFAGELTNQNQEYYKVNDKIYYLSSFKMHANISVGSTAKLEHKLSIRKGSPK